MWTIGLISRAANVYASRHALKGLSDITEGVEMLEAAAPGTVPVEFRTQLALLQRYRSKDTRPGVDDIVGVCSYCDTPRPNYMKRCQSCGAMEVKQ